MSTVTVIYHFEDDSWWAESPTVPEFVGGATTFDEVRTLTREGLAFTLDRDVELDERFDEQAMAARRDSTILHVTGFPSGVRSSTGSFTPPPRSTSLHLPTRSVASCAG